MKKIYKKSLALALVLILLIQVCPIPIAKAAASSYWEIDDLPYNIKFTDLKQGSSWNIALDENKDLWTWGTNRYGQLGNGTYSTTEIREQPAKLSINAKFTQIIALGNAWLALDTNGNIWGCGNGNYSVLGNGVTISESDGTTTHVVSTPIQITNGTEFTKLVGNGLSVLALDRSGNIWGWGENDFGILMSQGKGDYLYDTHYYINKPKQLTSGTKYIDIDCNSRGTAGAIDENNNLYMWGCNQRGQLAASYNTYKLQVEGLVTQVGSYNPVLVKGGTKFSKVSIGQVHVVALDIDGYVWVWGELGYLGISDAVAESMPGYENPASGVYLLYEPYKLNDRKYTDIYCTDMATTYARTGNNPEAYLNNLTYVWGSNNGLFGDGTIRDSDNDIVYVSGLENYTIIGPGLGIDKNGYMWRWGFDYKDSEGNVVKALEPIQITGQKVTYTVTFKDGNTVLKTETVNHGGAATAPTPTKPGYTFVRWDKEFDNVISNLEVNAEWSKNTNTAYTVEHYKENTQKTNYEIVAEDTETLTGTTEAQTAARAKNYSGFTAQSFEQKEILGNGSTVVKIYYTRNTYKVTLNTNKGTINSGNVTNYVYGVGATLPTPTRPGYTFAGWYNNADLTGEAIANIGTVAVGDKEYFAKWTESTGTSYTVEHYKQNLSGTYDKVTSDTEHLTGTTEADVQATAKPYEGYHENQTHGDRLASGKIKADGSLVLKLYYDINEYTVIFKNGDTILSSQKVKHGTAAQAPTPTKEGHTFVNWDKTFTNVTSDLTVNANWRVNTYEVTLNTNGGAIAQGAELTSYTYGVGATLPIPTKPGYTFAGWYNNSDLTGDAIANIGTNAVGDRVYFAKWTANTNTPYTVEYYYQQDDGSYTNTATTSVSRTGVTEQTIEVTDNDKIPTPVEGKTYVFDSTNTNNVLNGTILGNGNTVLKVYFKQQYTVTYKPGTQGTFTEQVKSGIDYNMATPEFEGQITGNAGYIFAGWTPQISEKVTNNAEYVATWIPGEGTAYKVEHYKQNLETNTYDLVTSDIEYLAATTGANVTATAKPYEGYTINREKSTTNGKVAGDGSLVLKLYYDINKYTVTFISDGETIKTETVVHGGAAQAPALEKEGYTLSWDKLFNNVTSNLEVNAIWTPGTGTAYTVEHYKQNAELNGYDLVTEDVKHLTGTTGATATIIGKTYEGFTENLTHPDRIASGEILADGSLVLRLYYDRNTYTIDLDTNGGTIKKEDEIKDYTYGKETKLPIPEKEGYAFGGWYDNSDFKGEAITKIGTGTTGDKNYYAKWEIREYTVSFVNDGKIVKTETVVYGQKATAPTLTRTGYILSWDKDFSNVKSDLTINAVWTEDPNYVDPNDGKDEAPSKLPQTGESYMIIGTMSVLISAAIFVYLKYRKLGNM